MARIILLLIIYLSFISLGLPDSLLGSSWTVMKMDLQVPLSGAGLIAMVVSGGTIVSSLFSHRLIKRFGTGVITVFSVFLTATALLGVALAPSFYWLILLAIPLGIGAGAVDAGLNNFVALHYDAHHMSWLHCFWGIGATLGPIIMAQFIRDNNQWRGGYLTVSMIQFVLVFILLLSLPLWRKQRQSLAPAHKTDRPEDLESSLVEGASGTGKMDIFRTKGLPSTLIVFLTYCGIEVTVGLWGSSYLVSVQQVSAATAALWIAMYFAGITVGRLITGFILLRIKTRRVILVGQLVVLAGILLLFVPIPNINLVGLILIGLGLAPIFPCLLHETPNRFGQEHSQRIMGLQMALAYCGATFLPPLFGLVAPKVGLFIFPFVLLVYLIIMVASSEKVNALMRPKVANEK